MNRRQDEGLLEAYDELIVAVNGQSITEGNKADKLNLGTQLFYSCRKYILHNRMNIDFREIFQKRKDLCSPRLQLKPLDNDFKDQLLLRYPIDEDTKEHEVDDKSLVKLWTKFCRNHALPDYMAYCKKRDKGGESGTYDDDAILEKNWKNCRHSAIDKNAI